MILDLEKFRKLNVNRAVEGFKCYENVPITYWTTALAGEIGELCNMVKKMERVSHGGIDGGSSYTASSITSEMLEEEIGGIAIYLDLLASLLNISLQEAIVKTFNSKSEKYGFKQYLNKLPVQDSQDERRSAEEIKKAIQFISDNAELTYGYRRDVTDILQWVLNGEKFDGLVEPADEKEK